MFKYIRNVWNNSPIAVTLLAFLLLCMIGLALLIHSSLKQDIIFEQRCEDSGGFVARASGHLICVKSDGVINIRK